VSQGDVDLVQPDMHLVQAMYGVSRGHLLHQANKYVQALGRVY
jgi:hypothetical protein